MGRLRRMLFLVPLVLSVIGAGAQDLETYVRENYLVPDPNYGFAPAHQHKALGREVFEVKTNGLKRVLEFNFGGL